MAQKEKRGREIPSLSPSCSAEFIPQLRPKEEERRAGGLVSTPAGFCPPPPPGLRAPPRRLQIPLAAIFCTRNYAIHQLALRQLRVSQPHAWHRAPKVTCFCHLLSFRLARGGCQHCGIDFFGRIRLPERRHLCCFGECPHSGHQRLFPGALTTQSKLERRHSAIRWGFFSF